MKTNFFLQLIFRYFMAHFQNSAESFQEKSLAWQTANSVLYSSVVMLITSLEIFHWHFENAHLK